MRTRSAGQERLHNGAEAEDRPAWRSGQSKKLAGRDPRECRPVVFSWPSNAPAASRGLDFVVPYVAFGWQQPGGGMTRAPARALLQQEGMT